MRKWYLKNQERQCRVNSERYHRERAKIFALLGGAKCAECDWTDTRALIFDHLDGDGAAHRKIIGNSWTKLFHDIFANPEKFQVLCCNHNQIKRIENNENAQKRLTKHSENPKIENT